MENLFKITFEIGGILKDIQIMFLKLGMTLLGLFLLSSVCRLRKRKLIKLK